MPSVSSGWACVWVLAQGREWRRGKKQAASAAHPEEKACQKMNHAMGGPLFAATAVRAACVTQPLFHTEENQFALFNGIMHSPSAQAGHGGSAG